MSRISAEALLLLVTALWGATFAIIKTIVDDVPPSTFTFFRFAVASILAVALWPSALRGWSVLFLRRGLVLGILYGLGFVLQAVGLALTTATSSALITGSCVAFVPIIYRCIDHSKIQRWHIVSVSFVLIGLYIFTMPDFSDLNIGDVLTLASAVVWAAYIAFLDVYTREFHSDANKLNGLVVVQFLVTTIMAGIAALFIDSERTSFEWTSSVVLGIAYCAIFASVITTWIQTRFQRFTHPVRVGIIFTAEPLFGAVIAWLTLGELMTPFQGLGAAIMFGAIIVPDLWVLWKGSQ